jgi:hypothetical protein
MRHILLLTVGTILLFASCSSNRDAKQNSKTKSDGIQGGEVVYDSLTPDQIDKIRKIQSTFAEVDPASLEERMANFQRDKNPDNEIAIWLQMADVYEKYLNSKNGKLDLNTKKEVYKLILSRSAMPEKEAIIKSKLTILTEKDAKEVLSHYPVAPGSN